MTDELMDAVMRELIEYCKQKDANGDCARYMDTGECAECSFKLTTKACRSYARKVNENIHTVVDRQAEDEGLWFNAETAPEAYLQQALRKLHRVIENRLTDKEQTGEKAQAPKV